VAAFLLLAPLAHAADGNELFALGAVQKGLGGAGAAHAHDATWITVNPAALVELGQRLDLSQEFLRMGTMLEPHGLPLAVNVGAGRMTDTNYVLIPAGAYLHPAGGGVLGVGGFGTQGNRVEYPKPRTTLTLFTNGDRRSDYSVVQFPLMYAHPLGRGWALGGGVVLAATRFQTDSVSLRFQEAKADNASDFEIGAGYVVGIHKQAGRLRLGAAYHSKVAMGDYEKYAELLTSSFDLPQKVRAGIALELRDGLEVLLDYKWIDWQQVDQLGNKTVNGGLAWRDQHIVKLGLNWDITPRWSVRGGVSHGESAIRDDAVFANATTPGISETSIALGGTWRMNEKHSFHVALAHLIPEERTENGKGDFFSLIGRGTRIGFDENSVTVQYTYSF
jgi:long-chain fatty acid transport protein